MLFRNRKSGKPGLLARFRRDAEGATAVEFGMIALPFFGILFAIVETGLVYLTGQVMETAVANASRLIMTGQVAKTAGPPAAKINKFKTELCNNLSWFIPCGDVYYDVQAYQTFGDTDMNLPIRNGSLDTSVLPRFSPGNPGQVVVVRAYYQMPVYTAFFGSGMGNLSGNMRLITGTAAFKNEPW